MSRALVIAQTRAMLLEKDAGFMRNAQHAIRSAAIRGRGAVGMVGTRARIAKGDLVAGMAMRKSKRAMNPVTKSFDRSLAAAGAPKTLAKAAPTIGAVQAKKGMGLGKKLMIGAGLLGAGAALGGAFSAGKARAAEPLAPPSEHPAGY